MDFNKIILTDHRGYLIDIHLEEFFKVKQFALDKYESSKLNSRRKSHIKKFCERAEKLVEETALLNMIEKYCNERALNKIIERIDEQILYVLNAARKFIEGPARLVPFSLLKIKARATFLY